MKLKKISHFRSTSSSVKFKLNCQDRVTEEWGTRGFLEILYKIQKQILIGHMKETKKDVIVKFENPSEIVADYKISETLFNSKIPNFIKYYCTFSCNENTDRFEELDPEKHEHLCSKKGTKTGFIIMPYYPLGSVKNYKWTTANFHVLKNIICQVIIAISSAFIKNGFVHGDLHMDNILLRKTKKKALYYNSFDITLYLDEMYAIVMDFGRSKLNSSYTSYMTSISTITALLRDIGENSDIIIDAVPLYRYLSIMGNTTLDQKVIINLINIIDSLKIDYTKSSRSK